MLILDEPTAALGVKEAAHVLRIIMEAKLRGLAVVLVTHNVTHAMTVGDHFAVLIHGKKADDFAKGERTREEITDLMAGGEAMAELEAELEALICWPSPRHERTRSSRWHEQLEREPAMSDDVDNEDVIPVEIDGRDYAIYRSPEDDYYATDGHCTPRSVPAGRWSRDGQHHRMSQAQRSLRLHDRRGTRALPSVRTCAPIPVKVEDGSQSSSTWA